MIDHPAVAAVRREIGWLHGLVSPTEGGLANSFKPEQARAMLRVEYSRAEERKIWEAARGTDDHGIARMLGSRHDGPLIIEGVAWYCVATLPEPGWRVINPMRAG